MPVPRIAATIGSVAGLVAIGAGAARWNVARLRGLPDAFTYDELAADVAGERVFIERPDGSRIHTVVAGEGPDVVLLHTYGVSMIEWTLVHRDLVELGNRVVCVDWRGHGRTTVGRDGVAPEVAADDLAAVLAHHDVTDAVVVGHAAGGYLALTMLLRTPAAADRLRGLVLVAGVAGEVAKDNPQTALQIPLITSGLMGRLAETDTFGLPFAASVWGPDPSPSALRVFLDLFITADHRALAPLLERLATTGWYGRLGEITVPTVVVSGAEDDTAPRWHQQAIVDGIAGARWVVVPDAGHLLNWQAPHVVVEAVTGLHGTGRSAHVRRQSTGR